LLTEATLKIKGGEKMCRWCIPINKNKDQQLRDSTENKNKDILGEEHEQVLNKT